MSVIDPVALKRLLDVIGGDPEDLQELLDEYCAGAPTQAASIREAAQAGDLDAMRIAVHALKSNARDFGATRLAELCQSCETACRAEALDDLVAAAREIEIEERTARDELSEVDVRDVAAQ